MGRRKELFPELIVHHDHLTGCPGRKPPEGTVEGWDHRESGKFLADPEGLRSIEELRPC
ncbi:MAG: hypothetical protein ACFFCW_00970 [Candidatus Hodarchaeota archaeon]